MSSNPSSWIAPRAGGAASGGPVASWLGVNVWVTRELAYGKWAY